MRAKGATDSCAGVRSCANFFRDTRGASAIEFGFVAIPFIGLLMAIVETALVFFGGEGLEAAVQGAARNIMTGQAQTANLTTGAQFVNAYMCPPGGPRILPSFIDCTKLIVDVRPATSFSSANLSRTFYQNASSQEFCPGAANTIVVVRVAYPMPVILPLLGEISATAFGQIQTGLVNDVPGNPGWKHLLVGTAVFQTESYGTYTPPNGC